MNVLSANQPSLEGKGGVGSETIYQQIWKELMKLKSLFLMIKSISILSLLIKIWQATIHIVFRWSTFIVRGSKWPIQGFQVFRVRILNFKYLSTVR